MASSGLGLADGTATGEVLDEVEGTAELSADGRTGGLHQRGGGGGGTGSVPRASSRGESGCSTMESLRCTVAGGAMLFSSEPNGSNVDNRSGGTGGFRLDGLVTIIVCCELSSFQNS